MWALLTDIFCCIQRPEDLWVNHSKSVSPKPHMKDTAPWRAIQKVCCMQYIFYQQLLACHYRLHDEKGTILKTLERVIDMHFSVNTGYMLDCASLETGALHMTLSLTSHKINAIFCSRFLRVVKALI